MSLANAHFQNGILKILADVGLQNGAQKVKETEHQFRVDFGCPFWPTWSHFSNPRGVSDLVLAWERKEQETALLLE